MEQQKRVLSCTDCGTRACIGNETERFPDFCPTKALDREERDEIADRYIEDQETGDLARTQLFIDADNYGKMCRVEETIAFIKAMGYKKVGIATCVGLLDLASIFGRLLRKEGIDYYACSCKIGAVDKTEIGLPPEKKFSRGCRHESTCNPIQQAKVLADQGTDFNVVIGLCVGHDALFYRHSAAPCTTMIIKDKLLGHNPVQALYLADSDYSRFK